MQAGILFLVSAPSGAGKTSLVNAALEADSQLVVSVSHTTRPARGGEVDGENYFFVSDDQFVQMIEEGKFLEHANVFGKRYGTSKAEVAAKRAQGKDVILEIDWQGAQQVRETIPDAISVFVLPPSVDELAARLTSRGKTRPRVLKSVLARPSWICPKPFTLIIWSSTLTLKRRYRTLQVSRRPLASAERLNCKKTM